MGLRVYLANVGVSADLEHEQGDIYIEQIFADVMGNRLQWFDRNYPDLPIMRRVLKDIEGYQNVYEWYVDFRDTESFVHYKLTYGYENEQ